MKRPLVVTAVLVLGLSPALPASAAPGRLWWTFHGKTWHTHENPTFGCCTVAADHLPPTIDVRNATAGVVVPHTQARCGGAFEFLPPGQASDFPNRSHGILH